MKDFFFFNVFARSTNTIITSFVRALLENIALGLQRPRKIGCYFERRQYFPVKPSSTGYYCITLVSAFQMKDAKRDFASLKQEEEERKKK